MQKTGLVRHLTFRQLNYLVTLGRIGSIHKAADLHGISQPALSKTLRELESVLGFKIFARSRRGVAPTDLGEILITQAIQMISNLDVLTDRLDAERSGRHRVYRIGATPNPALRLIPSAYSIARDQFPHLVLELVESSTDDLLVGLHRGEYSLVLGRSSPANARSSFKQTLLYPEIGVIVGRAGHPAVRRRHRGLQSLLPFSWILPQHGPTRAAIELAFMRAGCNPPIPSFINYATQVVCDLLVRSDALSVMPLGAVKAALASGSIKVVAAPADFQLPAYAMYKPVQAISDPALACFERAILQVASSQEEAHRRTPGVPRALKPAGRRSRVRKRIPR